MIDFNSFLFPESLYAFLKRTHKKNETLPHFRAEMRLSILSFSISLVIFSHTLTRYVHKNHAAGKTRVYIVDPFWKPVSSSSVHSLSLSLALSLFSPCSMSEPAVPSQ